MFPTLSEMSYQITWAMANLLYFLYLHSFNLFEPINFKATQIHHQFNKFHFVTGEMIKQTDDVHLLQTGGHSDLSSNITIEDIGKKTVLRRLFLQVY